MRGNERMAERDLPEVLTPLGATDVAFMRQHTADTTGGNLQISHDGPAR
jgi:hypothetical protein